MDELIAVSGESRMVVHVEKAEIPLKPGESMDEFRDRLRTSVSAHFKTLDIAGEIQSLWISDLYPDSVVAEVCWMRKRDASLKEQVHPKGYAHFQVGYTSKNTAIAFGEAHEVERRVTWARKSKVQKREQDSIWKGLF